MMPDPTFLLSNLRMNHPLIGVYDAPGDTVFPDIEEFAEHRRTCLFAFFGAWCEGRTLKITVERHGCGGCGHWWFGLENRTREEYIHFLADTEGLRADHARMGEWLDATRPYIPEHDALFTGLLYREFYAYLKTVMFIVNPDQLSILVAAASYHSRPSDPSPVVAEFGSGCMQSLVSFPDLRLPQAMIGSTDLAMRQHLPPDAIIFSVTVPMFERMCSLDENSFLGKSFLKSLWKAREWKGREEGKE
ncbi:MAG TPA: DUF169 domain-containing protein [Bacteroidales bacterium]|nr:DUF169 domain-containing protein [Bacteroidales bacterium]HRZ77759.1 DUF169 domain-containing protein [Bacteroidales bacterium]